MAYIPPHRRLSKSNGTLSSIPESFIPHFKRNLNFRSSDSKIIRSGKIVYADHAVSRWFAVGLDDDNQFPCSTRLEPFSVGNGSPNEDKPVALVIRNIQEDIENTEDTSRTPWITITEGVQKDLISSFETLRKEMKDQSLQKIKPTLVARLGKICFHDNHSLSLGDVDRNHVAETTIRKLKRSIHTNIPSTYAENITDKVIQKVGLDFEEEKDMYHVKLSDSRRPGSTVSCRCSVKEDKKLQLYKVELNQVRRMVNDISCLDKNLDLRVMLSTKMILTALSDDEMSSIGVLISSAVIDSNVKGGLRWPLGRTSYGDRYRVIGVWRTIHKTYQNPSLKLKVRNADRFDFATGTREFSREVYLKLKGIVSELQQEPKADSCSVSKMLEDNMRLIWENFLC